MAGEKWVRVAGVTAVSAVTTGIFFGAWRWDALRERFPMGILALAISGIMIGGLGFLAGAWTSRRARAAPRAPVLAKAPTASAAGPEDVLTQLGAEVRARPLDPTPRFQFGVALIHAGDVDEGVNHLHRSFRLHPEGILTVLQDPTLEKVRENPRVRELLHRVHRDYQTRSWSGYA